MEPIRSTSNSLVKRLRAVAKGRDRDAILLEGERLVADAVASGHELEFVLVREGSALDLGLEAHEVRPSVFDTLGSLKTTPDVLAVARGLVETSYDELLERESALIVVAAGVQDPGNLGALARTAEALGASGLVTLAGGCRPEHPRALRGSMGSLLRLRQRSESQASVVREALDARGVRSVVAATRGGVDLHDFDWQGRVALWLTAESGEGSFDASTMEGVTIPLAANVESLNVTQAAAVLLFAAKRTGGAL